MKTKAMYKLFALIIIFSIAFSECKSQYIIEKGCIQDNFKIKFVDQDIELTPNIFFSIKELNLKINKYCTKDFGVNGYKRKKLITYKITIERLNDNKIYYGRIAFYNIINKPEVTNKAVASYYKISIPVSYFEEAKDGITVSFYEYYI